MQTIFVVAPGPGVTAWGDLNVLLAGRRVLAVKWGFLHVADICEALWSTHARLFYQHADVIAYRQRRPELPCYAMRSVVEGGGTDGVITLEHAQDYGLCRDPAGIAFGKNSGHSGINVAYHLLGEPKRGSRLVLLGYDMRQVNGKSHAHRERATTPPWQYRNIFVPSFIDIAEELKKEGIECLNATPQSALEVFPHVDLRDVL